MPRKSNSKPATVKLIDEQVTEIVRVLGRFKAKDISTDGSVREIAALDQPALASLVARVAEIRVVALAENRSAYLAARGGGAITAWHLVHDRARLLGHMPMTQAVADGFSAECAACGATGGAHDDFVGAIFHLQCGTTQALASALKPEPCKACEARGLDGQCPACANERARAVQS